MSALFTWLGNLLLSVWRAFRTYLYWYYTSLLALAYVIYKSISLIGDMGIRVVQLVISILSYASGHSSDGCAPSGITTMLQIANTFFPLDEFFRLLFGLMILVWLPIGIYRFIRALVPEVFGWSLGHEG
jgi:hypothetical protein